MKQQSLASLFKAGVFNGISKLRQNAAGYPYVTLVGKHGSNNLYFGKKSAAIIGAKYELGGIVSAELANASVCMTTNAAGEGRYKLSLAGTSDYTQVAELESLFGGEQVDNEFDTAGFVAEFSTLTDTSTGGNADLAKKLESNPA